MPSGWPRSIRALPPALDAERHYLEGSPEEVAHFMLVLDSINFGSGWFPTLRKRPGMSGYFTVASSLTDLLARIRWVVASTNYGQSSAEDVATVLGQDPGHELMALYAEALRDLGRFLGGRRAIDVVAEAGGSAERLASMLAGRHALLRRRRLLEARPDHRERPRARRRGATSTTSTGSRSSPTTSCRTCCAWTACSCTTPRSPPASTPGELLEPGAEEREIRGCAVHACELLVRAPRDAGRATSTQRSGTAARRRDYKAVPRHRTRTVFY